MSKDKKSTIQNGLRNLGFNSIESDGFGFHRTTRPLGLVLDKGHRAKSKFATYFIAGYAMNTRATGQFCINECRQRPFVSSWAGALNVGVK